jgi:hypothetical protein
MYAIIEYVHTFSPKIHTYVAPDEFSYKAALQALMLDSSVGSFVAWELHTLGVLSIQDNDHGTSQGNVYS